MKLARLLCAFVLVFSAPALAQADLGRRTAQVEDLRSMREIKRLQAQWGYLALAGDWQAMAALGTTTVAMVQPGGNLVGRAALAQWLGDRFANGKQGIAAGRLNLQVWFSPVITLSATGDSATGRWRHLALTGENGVSADWRETTDVIEYRKTAEGWRMALIRPYLGFAGSYAQGWHHDAATLERAPYHFTPDQAGTVLPDRRAAKSRPAADLDREATLLLELGKAQNTANALGYYLDRAMYDDIADLFAPDAQIDVARQGVYNGAAGVRKFLGRYGAPGLDRGELNDHPLLMPLVSIAADGSMALVRVVDLGMTGQHGGQGVWSAAIDTFLLRPDGAGHWRVATLHQRPLMRADYTQGWAHPLDAHMSIGESQLPDGPGQPVDTSYPEHPFVMQQLGGEVIFAPRGKPQAPSIIANALALAEAFDAAENVTAAYGYFVDQFAWTQLADLFAVKGWRELPFIGVVAGRDKILAGAQMRYGRATPRAEFQTLHMLTQPFVTVSGDGARAQVRARLMQFNSASQGSGSFIGGVYEDQLVKELGVWKIGGMDLDYTWMANYQGGWTAADPAAANALRPSPELFARYQLDAPIRGEPGIPFPVIAALPFHYRNPVSGRAPARLIPWTEIAAKRTR
ncbi:MAG: nuclear transport factor 2 family protein [Croceibacterium sp.]